jgi:amino acid transporter
MAIVEADRAREAEQATLKPNAIGFLDSLVIGLASTAPAYSLAAIIGSLVVIVGVQAPAALLASFVPMFLIAGAFFYMNRADRDAGTTFSWVTRTLGPWLGWIGGWAVCTTGILVIGSLADVGARYTYLLFGADGAAGSKAAVTVLAVAYIVVLTWICILGTELSARIQNVMILAQVGALLLFAAVALGKVWSGDAGPDALDPSWSWFSPFAIDDRDALIAALLIGVFAYWGWESAVNLCEETSNSRLVPGLSALTSTVILVVTYVSVAVAVVAFAGLARLEEFDDDEGIFGVLALDVLGSPWDKLVILAIVTSAVASTQTTIIPASRTTLSMARSGAYPSPLARIHPRYRTPHVATAVVATLAIAWYVPANLISENFLFDSLSALALMIAFYYALSGVACLVYYRRELTKSAWNLIVIGIGPAVGAFLLGYLFVEATRSLSDTGASYSGQEILGVAPPLAIGYGFLLLGVVLVIAWRLSGKGERFFARHAFETVDPAVASGEVRVEEDQT